MNTQPLPQSIAKKSPQKIIQQSLPLEAIALGNFVFSSLILAICVPFFVLNVKSTNAQIAPDSTLGSENSVVTPNVEVKGKLADVIEGGATRGVNLFHSFSEFNIGEGGAAYFANPAVIQNIFSRVTGGNPSHIFGTLGVLGNANLFFINPSGIVFGNGASLDVRGTFVGSTANELIFPDGNKFSATNPQGVPLLTIDVQPTVGIQLGEDSGNIINQADLSTSTGQSIILMGNKVDNSGSLTAPGGTVKLMGNEVNLEGESVIDVSASSGGGVVMIGKGENGISTAESVSIGENVSIKADALLEGNGGVVEIEAGEIVDFQGSISATGGVISGDGGKVVITAPEVVNQGSVDVTAINGNLGVVDISSNQGLEENQQETSTTLVSSTEADVSEEGEENNSVSSANVNSQSSATPESAVSGEGEENNSVSPTNVNSQSSTTSESAVNVEGGENNSVSSANVNSPSSATSELAVTSSSIVPDDSLGAESSEIEAIDESNERVIGGAERGVNLFHSFLEFNIETDKGVYFANPEGINNIVTRVTGNNISEIRGTLGVEGSANLFFINPNGLFFNQNASLNLNGSFFASTAQAVIFNEFEYSAVNPNLPPIIVGVNGNSPNPTGLRFGENPGDIILKNEARFTEQGDTGELIDTAQSVNDNNTSVPDGIQGDLTGGNDADLYRVSLEADKPFSATTVGGSDVDTSLFLFNTQGLGIDANEDSQGTFQSTLSEFTPTESGVYYLGISSYANSPVSAEGEIFARDGFEFAGLGVGGNSPLSGWNQKGSGNGGGYVISLSSGNGTTPTGNLAVNPGQTLALIGGNVTIDGVKIISPGSNIEIGGLNQAGIISLTDGIKPNYPNNVTGGDVNIINDSIVNVFSDAIGNAGKIEINTGSLTLNNGAELLANTRFTQTAKGGNITINATDDVFLNNSSAIVVWGSEGGSINITAKNLTVMSESILVGGIPSDSGFAEAQSGDIVINLTEDLVLDGLDAESAPFIANVSLGTGNAGNIEINARNIDFRNGGNIFSPNNGEGNIGTINLNATGDITFDGIKSSQSSGVSNFVDEGATGDVGEINITAQNLTLTNGASISSKNDRTANGGDIKINVADTISISGFGLGEIGDASLKFPSNISSNLASNGVGNSGNINIETESISLSENGFISTEILGQGNSGSINITANTITIDGEGNQSLPLSSISSNALSNLTDSPLAEANGGNIFIDTNSLSIKNGGEITSDNLVKGGTGSGGNIQINATEQISIDGTGIILVEENEYRLSSQISARTGSDVVGNGGSIKIKTPQLILSDEAVISTSSGGQGDAGIITINATESISLKGQTSQGVSSRIASEVGSNAIGDGGEITLNTNQLLLDNNAQISSKSDGAGDAGNIIINAPYLVNLDNNSSLTVETDGSGKPGKITINSDTVNIGKDTQISATVKQNSTNTEGEGRININASNLNISGQLGIFAETEGIAPAGNLIINPYNNNPNLNIKFTEDGFISARTTNVGDGGSITITAPSNIDIRGLGSITAETNGNGNAGNIDINTQNLTIADQVSITTSTESSGNAGLITFDSSESLFLTNEVKITSEVREGATGTSEGIIINTPILSISDRSAISAATQGEKIAGDITINATDSVTIDNDSLLNVQTDSIGKAGNIQITTDTLTIGEDSELSAKTTINATGDAGSINIFANILDITGKLGIFAETDGIADAGSLNINPNDNPNLAITFFDEGQISASTSNAGDGGDININAPQTIDLQGNGTIKVETTGTGKAGNINFNSQQLNISEGVTISALTSGEGEAGSINLEIGEEIIIDSGTTFTVETDGEKDAGNIELTANKITIGDNAELSARSKENASGKAGDIILNTNQLTIFGDKGIFASTEGEGEGGKITIQPLDKNLPLQISFFNDGIISASTDGSGKGGNIEIKDSDVININGDGNIQVEANSSGKAGSIIINADNLLNLNGEINISASTFSSGEAGNINFSAPNSINISGDGIIKVETEGSGEAGSIFIESNEINLSDGITLSASTSNIGDSKDITLTGNFINLDNATIQALTTGEGNPGSILISNGENKANQVNIVNNSTISTEINGEGDRSTAQPANININSDNLSLQSSEITASTTSNRDAGNINLTGNNFNLDNSNIQALTEGEGNPGSIFISNGEISANQVNITNNSTISTENRGEGDRENALPANITINSEDLFLQSSQITASTTSNRDAGNINLIGNNFNLDNGTIQALTTNQGNPGSIVISNREISANQVNIINNSTISTEINGEGNRENALPADITINTNNLSLDSSKITASTSANRDAGNITIPDAQNINLINNSKISTSTDGSGDAGEINFLANNINLNNSQIEAFTTNSGEGGNINIPNSENLNLVNNSEISASTTGEGFAGSIDLNVNQAVSIDSGSKLKVETENIGDAGDIEINTPTLTIGENAELTARSKNTATGIAGNITLNVNQLNIEGELGIFAETEGVADAGNLTINPLDNNLNLNINFTNEGNISASTDGSGDGGDININADENISISGDGIIAVKTEGSGFAGSIFIDSNQINLTDGVEISASTSGSGDSNNITIKGSLINLDNATINAETSGLGNPGSILISNGKNNASEVNLTNNSIISTEINADGNVETQQSADITINADNLSLDTSKITASTSANRNAGKINILNTDNLNLSNNSEITAVTNSSGEGGNITITDAKNISLSNNSKITASTNRNGKAGNINILNADNLNLSNNSEINVLTNSSGFAGNITINTPNLNLDNGGSISASTTASGEEGNIDITNSPNLTISGEGKIAVETRGDGKAGIINLFTEELTLKNGVEVTASTFASGKSGDINFFADNINLDNALIQAITSGSGKGGNINIPDAENLHLVNNSQISASTTGEGFAGSIDFNLNQTVNIDSGSQLKVETESIGDAGDIEINTPNLNLDNDATISASTIASGEGGNIDITNSPNLTISGEGKIAVETTGDGKAGIINLSAEELILKDGVEMTASTVGSGDAGNINFNAHNINFNQAEINAFTNSTGNAGNINLYYQEGNSNNITLTNSTISTEIQKKGVANKSSEITIQTDKLNANNSTITASTSGKGNAGNITITNAEEINLNNSQITATTSGKGDTGEINLSATDKINLTNNSEINSSVETGGVGNSRQITLDTPQLQLRQNSEISAETAGKGDAGQISIQNSKTVLIDENSTISTAISKRGAAQQPANITINTNTLTLNNKGKITASSAGIGDGGDININTITPLILNNQASITSALDETGKGKGGNIIINAPSIFLDNQSQINASNSGFGEGGFVKLTIDNQVNLDNRSIVATTLEETGRGIGGRIEIDAQQVNLDNQSQLRASTLGEGDADSITINADTVELINGSKIRTETTSEFDAGNITLNLSESLFISDEGSGLFANTEENSRGDGGDINVNSPIIIIEDNGAIAVNSSGEGIGGDIEISANRLNLENSDISAETVSTDGGNINLNIKELLTLNNNSNITATAGTAQAGGNGGNIDITTPFIIAVSRENSDITANAFFGNGGNININTNAIFGLEVRNQRTILSDITASSEFGLEGNININTAGIDPVRGLANLPQENVNTNVELSCQSAKKPNTSSFKIKDTGNLPRFSDTLDLDISEDNAVDNFLQQDWIPLKDSSIKEDNQVNLFFNHQ